MNFITKILVSGLAVFLTAYLLPGVSIDGYFSALIVGIVLSILNTLVKPILVIFTIPATILSLGLFLFVINAIIIMLADDIVDGFAVRNFWWALLFSIILSFVNSIFNRSDSNKKSKKINE
jgi:putative membrane protein